MRKQHQYAGFTLIELVITLIILGVLAATALPRFINLSSDAKKSVIVGIEGALRSTSSLVFQKALIDGVETGSITVDGKLVKVDGGYISGHWNQAWRYALDIGKDISYTQASKLCTVHTLCGVGSKYTSSKFPDIPANMPSLTGDVRVVAVWLQGMAIQDQCYAYYYKNPVDDNAPTIGSVTSGC